MNLLDEVKEKLSESWEIEWFSNRDIQAVKMLDKNFYYHLYAIAMGEGTVIIDRYLRNKDSWKSLEHTERKIHNLSDVMNVLEELSKTRTL